MTLRPLVFTALLVWIPACATTSASAPPAAAPTASTPPTRPAAAPVQVDRSLSLEKYVELGVPSPERSWSSADYVRAEQAFSALVQKQSAELPHYQSERSGLLFSRLTAFENVDLLQKDELAPVMQVQMLSTLMASAANILTMYLNAHAKHGTFATEMLELQSFAFHGSSRMVVALGQLDPADAADPKAFASAMAQVRVGMDRVMEGALTSLSERNLYSDADRLRFVGRFKDDLPAMLSWLQPLTRKEIPVRLESLIKDERSPELKEALSALRPVVAVP